MEHKKQADMGIPVNEKRTLVREGARDGAYLDDVVGLVLWRITARRERERRQKGVSISIGSLLIIQQLLLISVVLSPGLFSGEIWNLSLMLVRSKSVTSTEREKSGTSSWGSNLSSAETKTTGCFSGRDERRQTGSWSGGVFWLFTLLLCFYCAVDYVLLGWQDLCHQLIGGGLSVAAVLRVFLVLEDSSLGKTFNRI